MKKLFLIFLSIILLSGSLFAQEDYEYKLNKFTRQKDMVLKKSAAGSDIDTTRIPFLEKNNHFTGTNTFDNLNIVNTEFTDEFTVKQADNTDSIKIYINDPLGSADIKTNKGSIRYILNNDENQHINFNSSGFGYYDDGVGYSAGVDYGSGVFFDDGDNHAYITQNSDISVQNWTLSVDDGYAVYFNQGNSYIDLNNNRLLFQYGNENGNGSLNINSTDWELWHEKMVYITTDNGNQVDLLTDRNEFIFKNNYTYQYEDSTVFNKTIQVPKIRFEDGSVQTTAYTGGGGGGDSSWTEATVSDTLRINGVIKFSDGTILNSSLSGTVESTNQGEVMVRNAYVTSDETDGNVQSFSWGFDSSPVLTTGVISDGTGGFDSIFVRFSLFSDSLYVNNDNDTTEVYSENGDPIRLNKSVTVNQNGIVVTSFTGDVSNPPTESELNSLIGTISDYTGMEIYVIDSNSDNMYKVSSDGNYWYTWAGIKAN